MTTMISGSRSFPNPMIFSSCSLTVRIKASSSSPTSGIAGSGSFSMRTT